ncbi:hypothetical protein BLOT_000475 [Blomia tropicalis]|nr:hypothetical protein BLOT_000475 [Blomia tropicalis]
MKQDMSDRKLRQFKYWCPYWDKYMGHNRSIKVVSIDVIQNGWLETLILGKWECCTQIET